MFVKSDLETHHYGEDDFGMHYKLSLKTSKL